jgi:hypothetical protein
MLKGAIHILINDATVSGLVGTNKAGDKVKVYPGICPEPEQHPFIVGRISSAPDFASSKNDAVEIREYSFNLFVYTKNYEDLDELTEAIKTALDQANGEHNDVDFDEIRYVDFSDGYVDDYQLHARTMVFTAVVRE